jgi:hypothetical protein
MDWYLASQSAIEREVKLAWHYLHNLQIPGMLNLLCGQIESPFTRLQSVEVNCGSDIGRLKPVRNPPGTAQSNLGAGDILRADFQVLRNVMKFNGHIDRHFGHGIVRDRKPQSHS